MTLWYVYTYEKYFKMGNDICPDDDQLTRTATVDLVGTIDLALTWVA